MQGKFPEISRLRKQGEAWDRIGLLMARSFHRSGSRQARQEVEITPETEWAEARAALYSLCCTYSQDLGDIRKRMVDASTTTPLLLSTMSLWLAGHLKKPVTLTTPLVATVLLAFALEGRNVWEDAVFADLR